VNRVQAGVARVCITPPIGVELAGYGPFLNRRSESIHDNLYAEALVLDDGSTRTAIVTSDLIACDEAFVATVRGRSSLATGIKPSHTLWSVVSTVTQRPPPARSECGEHATSNIYRFSRATSPERLHQRHVNCGRQESDVARENTRNSPGTGFVTVKVMSTRR